jgi:hypothetical protein
MGGCSGERGGNKWSKEGSGRDEGNYRWANTLREASTRQNIEHWEKEGASQGQKKRHQTSTKNKNTQKETKKEKRKEKNNNNIYTQKKKHRNKKYKNKVFLNTTYNKERYNTNIWDNTKIIKYHILPNKSRKTIVSSYIYYNKQTLQLRGDIKTISGPKMSILQNHPQIHHDDKHKTYLYKNTIHLQTHLDNYTTYFYAHTRKKPRKTMSLKIQKQKEKITKKYYFLFLQT